MDLGHLQASDCAAPAAKRLVAKGPLHVEVSRKYALEETPRALADVARHHLGKLAVTVHA